MVDKLPSKTQSVLRDLLSRREIAVMGGRARVEFFDGTGVASQTQYLARPADQIYKILVLHSGSTEYTTKDGKELKQVSSLTGQAWGYTLTDGVLLTFGDGTDGWNPPDTSALDHYAYVVIYSEAILKEKTTTLTWTEQVVADNVAPDTDTAIYARGADEIYCQWDTNGATTGAPTFDFHIEGSDDGVTYTSGHYATLDSAVAKDVVDAVNLTPGPKFIKGRLDVNTANLAAAEYVTLKVVVRWKFRGTGA